MRWLSGVLSALKQMVNGRTQASMGQTPQAQPGANNTSVPTRGGKAKSQAAQTPAKQKPRRKPSAVRVGTTAPSRKRTPKAVQQERGQDGRQPATPASQPASKSAKRKPSAAQPTTAAKSRKPASKPAQTTSGKRGRPRKTPV